MQLQYLRGILLINNLVAATVTFSTTPYWGGHTELFYPFAGFLLASWLMNVMMIVYTFFQNKTPSKHGYFRLPQIKADDRPKSSFVRFFLLGFLDLMFGISLIVFSAIGYSISWDPPRTMSCTGGVVAATVHLFFVVVAIHENFLGQYRLKLVLVNLDEEDNDDDADASSTKEQTPPGRSTAQLPEQSIVSPYRGSPSTKPSHGTTLHANSPIKLIEPTEADALVGDHD